MGLNCAKASKIAAFILILVNGISMIFSTLLFTLSLWIIASPSTLLFAVQTFGSELMKVLFSEKSISVSLGVGLAVLSCFIFFISFMGFYGAISCSQFLLFMYSTLVLLLLLLECALMFYFSSDIVERGIRKQDGQWTHALRLTFDCCEYNATLQNFDPSSLPWSCCGVKGFPTNCTASQSSTKDCKETFIEWLDGYETAIYVCLAIFHVVLSSCSLVRRAYCSSRPHT